MQTALTRRAILTGMAALSTAPLAAQPVPAGLTVRRLAWAGIRLSVPGVDLFIDATASPPTAPPVQELQATNGARVFALATHHHSDHCDIPALRTLLGARGVLTLYEETARLVTAHDIAIQAARLHEPVLMSRGGGEFVARCVLAADGLGSPQVAWVIDAMGKRMIHCGDSAWHGGWWDIARTYGPFDAAFLPINGFRDIGGRFAEVTEPMSLTPEQAARAARILGVRLTVPIHYGATADGGYVEEADALRRFQAEAARLNVPIRAVAEGDSLIL